MTSERPSTHQAANDAGLVCGFHFTAEDPARAIDLAEAAALLAAWQAGEPAPAGFLWLHLNLSDMRAQHWLDTHAALTSR
jgi:zinc transporter